MTEQQSIFQRSLHAVFHYKFLVAGIFFSIMGLTVLVTLLMPKQYESNMQIVVQDSREKPLEAASQQNNAAGVQDNSQELIESRVNSEMELLSADDIMQSAVHFRAGLDKSLPNPDPGSVLMAKQIAKLEGRLKLTPVRKTNVLEVSYRDKTPEIARQVLGQIQLDYLTKHLHTLRPEGTTQLFAQRSVATDQQLVDTQNKLVKFETDNHIVSIDGETDDLSKQLAALRADEFGEETGLASSKAQLQSMHRLMDPGGPVTERVDTTSRVSSNVYATQQVNGMLVELQNKRTTLLTRFQPTDPLVVEMNQQIAETKATLKQLGSDPNVERDSDINPVWNQLQQQMRGAEVAVASGNAKLTSLKGQEQRIENRLNELKSIGVEDDRLQREVSELRDTAKLYADKSEAERLEAALDSDRVGNVAVAMQPTFSRYPVSPRTMVNLVLGFITAIIACIAVLFILESGRTTFYSPSELESAAGLRVLSSVPEFHEEFGKGRASA